MHQATAEAGRMIFSAFRPSRYRTMRQFAEDEIIVPSGPFEGFSYSTANQPFTRHWFDAVDSGKYSELVITGPSQSGKSLNGFVIPILHTLFELREPCIAAVPDDDMVREKWERDILPVIERTRYRDLLPAKGPGSRGGRVGSTQFGNGARLIWMTAGGSDKSRAGITSRVVCMTETDGFDVRTSTSDEADKIKQIEVRTEAYDIDQRRIFKECTVSTEYGHTWKRYKAGTASKIVLPCPHCKNWVQPEREHFRGWEGADNEIDAMEQGAFFCSECGEEWSEEQRIAANHESKLVHKGQEIDKDGNIHGQAVKTMCLGFRWSAVNNCIKKASGLGLREFRAKNDEDEDNAEREMCQFVWCNPYKIDSNTAVRLTAEEVCEKQAETGRGQIPEDTIKVGIGVDFNRPVLHWTAISWSETDGLIHDYSTTGVDKNKNLVDALVESFHRLATAFGVGWSGENWLKSRGDKPKWYDGVAVDCRYETEAIIQAMKELKLLSKGWIPFQGFGKGQFSQQTYSAPKRVGQNRVLWIGDHCHIVWSGKHKCRVLHADSNYWKSWMHKRIDLAGKEERKKGSLRLYATANPLKDHHTFGRHITAEVEEIGFEKGKGEVRVWNPIRSANHWGDSSYMGCVLGNRLGFGKKKQPSLPAGPDASTPRPLRRRSFRKPRNRIRRT